MPAPVERSTCIVFSSVALLLLFWKWQPFGWLDLESGKWRQAAICCLYAAGRLIVLAATFLINHFDLFGLRQVCLNLRGRAYTPQHSAHGDCIVEVGIRYMLAGSWCSGRAPVMVAAHLVFAVATTAYIFVAIQFEERDLIQAHAEYAEYRQRVPMILPVRYLRKASDADILARAVTEVEG